MRCIDLSENGFSSRLFMVGGLNIIREDWQLSNHGTQPDSFLWDVIKNVTEEPFSNNERSRATSIANKQKRLQGIE